MNKIPNKHFVAHAGHLYQYDVVQVLLGPNAPVYFGRVALVPKGSTLSNMGTFIPTPDGYLNPETAYEAAHIMMNRADKLGSNISWAVRRSK